MSFIFQTVDVKEELLNALERELANFGYTGELKVKVIKADPQSPSEIPCIGINRVSDDESGQSLTDSQGTLYNKDTKELKTFYGTFFSEAMEIRVWHTNGDERDKLYSVVKAILVAIRGELSEKGLLNITLRGGRDEQDSTMAQAPMVLYWAPITMSYLNPLDVQFTDIVEPITAVPDRGRFIT
jgi:hypothetical protein